MSSFPRISVLLPVYNGERFLHEAIDSILQQTFPDFELLILNDGSTDSTEEIIRSYSDSRIRYLKNEQNLRLIATLNKGIEHAKGTYIARMDADDVAMPKRLEKQYSFMEMNPQVGLCGTFLQNIGRAQNVVQFSTSDEEIRYRLLFSTYLRHPTVMMRQSVIKQHHLRYNESYLHVEDYKLWRDFAEVSQLAIIPEVLLQYRVHESNISTVYQQQQAEVVTRIRSEVLQALGISPMLYADILPEYNAFLSLLRHEGNPFLKGTAPQEFATFKKLYQLVLQIFDANRSKCMVSPVLLEHRFGEALWQWSTRNTHWGVKLGALLHGRTLFRYYNPGIFPIFKFIVKCSIRKSYSP